MLTITPRAVQELKATLESNAAATGHVLRIDTECDGFSIWIGPEVEGDTLVGSEDTFVLHVSPELSRHLADASVIIDVRQSVDGPRLVVYREEDLSLGSRVSRHRSSKAPPRGDSSSKAGAKTKTKGRTSRSRK